MENYADPDHEGNSSKYITNNKCDTHDCSNFAGTAWSPHWCFDCNIKRINKISKQFNALLSNVTK